MEKVLPTIIILGYMAFCIILGYVAMRQSAKKGKLGDSDDYFIAGRSTPPFLGAMTYIATVFSAYIFLGSVGSYFALGVGFNVFLLSEIFLIAVFIPTVGLKVWEMAGEHQFVTPSDFVAQRYDNNKIVRVVYAIIMVAFTLFFMSAQLVGVAYIMETVTGGWLSYTAAIWCIGAVLAVYIAIGGYQAVVLTDCMQSIMLIGAVLITFVLVLVKFDLSTVFTALQTIRGAMFDTPGPVPIYTWKLWISQFLIVGLAFVLMPQLWVRLYALNSKAGLKSIARHFTFWTTVIYICAFVFAVACSVAYAGKEIAPDKLILSFLFDSVPAWFAATLLSGAVAASLSTVNSQVLCLSSIITRDLYTKIVKNPKSVNEATLGRILTGVLVLVMIVIAFYPPKLFFAVLIDATYPGMAACISAALVGLFWKRATTQGAIASLIVGFIAAVYLVATKQNPMGFYSGLWVFVLSFVSMWVVSMLTPAQVSPDKNKSIINT